MKKLIAMIGAVAMSFGLFAATSFTTSFDTGDDGVSGTEYTSADAGWTGLTDPLTLKAYDTETDPAYVYDKTDRRFAKDNLQYLPLETERTNALNHAIGDGNIFVDQLVRFTGFEDPQTNLVDGVKIAVWMGEFFNDEETAATTNLYVTVGSDYLEGQIAVKLDGTYEINKWYRLTIKSLGDIFNAGTSAPRAGFCIWIDGDKKAIASDDDHHEGLILRDTQLKDAAKAAYAKSQLFPAVSSGSDQIALNSFGYNGIGAIDDVYVDDEGPDFTAEEYVFTVVGDGRVKVASVYAGGTPLEEPYTVAPGTAVTITWEAKDGYKIRGAVTQTTTIDTPDQEVAVDEDQVKILDVVATVTNAGDVEKFAADELYEMINNLVNGDEVLFKKGATIKDGEANTLYVATAGSTIAVTVVNDVTTWAIYVAGEFAVFTDNVGADAAMVKNFTFEDEDYGTLVLGGNVAGVLTSLAADVTENIDVTGTLTVEYLTVDTGTITLDGNGKVIANDGTLDNIVGKGGATVDVLPDTPDEGWFTYQISGEPPVPGETFTVTVPPLTEGLTIASIVTNSVPVDPAIPGDYTLNEGELFTMTYAPDEGYKFTDDLEDGVREAEEETRIEPPAVEEIPYVAQIGNQKFETLAAAFTAAQKGNTITMLKDVVLSERIFVMNEEVTLDLAGKKIEWDTSVANKSGVLIVCRDAQLTIDDSSEPSTGVIDAKGKAYAAVALTHGDDPKNSQTDLTAKLIVNGGTLIGNYQGIVGNGTRPNTYIEINGGVITASNEETNQAIFNPQTNSVVVINDGTITGLDSAIEMRGGTLTVNGGTLTSTAEMYAVKPNGSGSTVVGAAVAVSQHTTKGDLAVEIKGGTLTGLNAVAVANPQGNDSENVGVVLGDATYNGALAFSADGNATVTNDGATIDPPADYKWDENGNLVKKVYVAQIGANKYETFDAAWAAAQGNDEITLLADCTFGTATSAQVKLNKNLKLTLNGKVLTVKNKKYDRIYVVDNKTLTVDGTAEGSKLIGTLYAGIRLSAGHYSEGNIAINGGTYVASDHNEYGLAAIQSNGGCENSSITATDATFIGGNMSVEPTDDNRDQQGIAAVLAAGGTYTFTDCEFTGRTGIYAKAGTLTLDDCTVAANGTQFAPVANTDGSDPTGDAIIFDSNSSYNGDLTLVVTGDSSISSENGYAFQETVTKGSASATLAVSIADTVDVDGEVVLSDAFAAAVKAGTAAITGYVATVNNIAYQTVAEALLAVQALEAEEEYPITVAALAADGLTITDGDNTAKIAAGVTITITKGAWTVNDTLNYAGEIDGAVTAVAIAKIEDAAITLNKDASVTITGDVVPETSFFACGAGDGYEVKKNGNVFTVGLIQVTATFVADGKTVDTQVIDYGTAPAKPADPVKEGYTFTGWNPEIGVITEDTTYTAQFDEDPYDLTVTTPENGTLTTDPVAGKIEAGTTVTVTATPDTGYALKEVTFNGAPVDKWDSFTMPHEPMTVAATFTAEVYTITYTFTGVEAGDVEKILNTNPKTYTIESETITFADASCEGYTFKGWDITKIDAGSTGNKTITGTFEKAEDPLPIWVPAGEKEAYNTWKQGPGKTESDFTGDVDKKMEDSFLLDCEPTEAALQTAKANFKITSITKDDSGNWVVLTVDKAAGQSYGNGLIKLEAFESVGCTGTPVTPGTQPQLFWKASLVHPTAN